MSEWIISSSVLVLLVIVLRFALRGKISLRLQYALWLVVLVRLLMPVSLADSSFSVAGLLQMNRTLELSDIYLWYGEEADSNGAGEYLPDSEGNGAQAGQPGEGQNGVQNDQAGGENPGNQPGNADTPADPELGVVPDEDTAVDEAPNYPAIGGVSIAPSTEKLENSGKEHISLSRILTVIWCAGMAVTSVILLVSNLRFWKNLRKTRWIYEKRTDALPVYESDVVETPCLFGLIRPAIYVTQEAIEDPKIMHHVLAHETTHYAHRDHIWAALRCLCLVLHWYNPLVWWAAALSRRDAELACDEGTIERIGEAVRAEYGRTLIGLTCQGRGFLLSTATTMTGSAKGIRERIMLIANRPKMARYTVMILIVLVMVMIGCTYCGVKEADVGGIKGNEMIGSLSAELLKKMEMAYLDQYNYELILDQESGYGNRYYGNYDGAVAIFREGQATAITQIQVAGVIFEHPSSCTIDVYVEEQNRFYSLREAYYGGFLKKEDLLTMQEYHMLCQQERGYDFIQLPKVENIHSEETVTAGSEIIQKFKVGTTVLADVNGDGVKEKISFALKRSEYSKNYIYCMQVDDEYYDEYNMAMLAKLEQYPEREYFYLIDLDTSDNWVEIAVVQDGGYNLPSLKIMRYKDGQQIHVGTIPAASPDEPYSAEKQSGLDIPGDSTITGYDYTQGKTVTWTVIDSKVFEAVPKDAYEPGKLHTDDIVEAGDGLAQTFDTGKTILADLDGDGIKEKITVMANESYTVSDQHAFFVQVNDAFYDNEAFNELMGGMESAERKRFYLIDIDPSDKWLEIAFYDYGTDLIPETTIFRYSDGRLVKIGSVPLGPPRESDVREMHVPGDGTLYGGVRDVVIETVFLTKTWKLTDTPNGEPAIEEVVSEYYSIMPRSNSYIKNILSQELQFFADKEEDSKRITLPVGTEIELQRFYPEEGWIQISYDKGNKTAWLRRDENRIVFPMEIHEIILRRYITGS